MRDQFEYCGECRNCFLEPPAYNTWDCKYGLDPEWDEENECWECEKYKEIAWEDD